MLPTSTDIKYFIEIANTKNLSRASERLGLSQPSLSLSLQRLESCIGTTLLLRNKKGVILTQAGKQFLAHSRQLMQTWEQIKNETLASANEIQGAYSIGSHPSAALYSLVKIFPKIMHKYPKLNIEFHHDLSRKVTEQVISSTIDIGLVINPVKHPDLIIHKLCDDQVSLWISGSQKMAESVKTGTAVLICDPQLIQSQSIIKKMKVNKVKFSRVMSCNNLEVITELTSNGCGIGVLPSRVANNKSNKLKRLKNAPVFYDEVCLIYRLESKNVKAIQTLVSEIKSFFNN